MRIRFHFRAVPFVACLLLVVLGIGLAQWQTRRAHEKQAIEAQLTVRAGAPVLVLGAAPLDVNRIEYRRVRIHGHFLAEWPLYLDNRPQDGRPGFYLVMPFQIAGTTMHVMVERGWLPLNRSERNKIFPYRTPSGDIDIEGTVRRQFGHVMQLGNAAPLRPGAVLQNLTLEQVGRAAGLRLQPLLLEEAATPENADDGLRRAWPPPSSGIERHQGYAFQWYALALMAFVFFLVTGLRRESN